MRAVAILALASVCVAARNCSIEDTFVKSYTLFRLDGCTYLDFSQGSSRMDKVGRPQRGRVSPYTSKPLARALKHNTEALALALEANHIGDEGAEFLGEALAENKVLKYLNLNGNMISGAGVVKLVDGLKSNIALETLLLGANREAERDGGAEAIVTLLQTHPALKRISLAQFHFSIKQIKAISGAISTSKLEHVDFESCKLGPKATEALVEGLEAHTTLKTLNLGHNELKQGVASVGKLLKKNTLKSLSLVNCHIHSAKRAESTRLFAEALAENTALEKLDYGNNMVGDEGARHFGEALKRNKALRVLGLHSNSIGDEGLVALAEGIKGHPKLEHLALGFSFFTDTQGSGMKALADALRGNTLLKSLDLMSTEMGDAGAIALAGVLNSTAIETLNLRWAGIGEAGTVALAEALKSGTAVKHLTLTQNPAMGDKGGAALAEVINATSIRTLSLHDCKLTVASMGAWAEALKSNPVLEELSLGSNILGSKGVDLLAQALAQNSNLRSLDLEETAITQEGAEALGAALKNNTGLKKLILVANSLKKEGMRALANSLQFNDALEILHLRGTEMGPDGARALRRGLKQNIGVKVIELDDDGLGVTEADHQKLVNQIEDYLSLQHEERKAVNWKEIQKAENKLKSDFRTALPFDVKSEL